MGGWDFMRWQSNLERQWINDLDLINRRGTPDLILAACCVMDGAGVLPVRWRRWASSRGGAMGGARRRSLSHATVHHLGWGFFLQGQWGLGN
jgi:hypothetical protein